MLLADGFLLSRSGWEVRHTPRFTQLPEVRFGRNRHNLQTQVTSYRPPPSRSPGKWWLLAFVLVAISAWAFNAILDTSRAETTLGEELRSHTITLDRASRSFVRLIEQINTLDRSELAAILTQSRDSLNAVSGSIDQAEGSADSLIGLLGAAIDLWQEGLVGFEEAFLTAVDDPFNYVVEEQLIASLVSIRGGDRVYGAFLEKSADDPDIQSFSDFRTVIFLPVHYPVVSTAEFLTTYARVSRPSLEFNTDLAIEQITSYPEWISDLEGRPVIIPTDSFDLLVVVANRGNVEVAGDTSLELSVWPPGEAIQTRVLDVPPLSPGEKTTVTFFELAVTPDTSYQVEIRLSYIDGDQTLDDNSYSFTLQVSA
jgi:hypothetical protein